MNNIKWLSLIGVAMWVSSAIAISVAIYYTKSMHCLWFLLIPAISNDMHITFTNTDDDKEN